MFMIPNFYRKIMNYKILIGTIKTICYRIDIEAMGCLESKMLGIQNSSDKYQINPIQINQNYDLNKKKMVKINIDELNLCTSLSINSLKFQLDDVIAKFEKDKGQISYRFQQKYVMTDRTIQIHKNQITKNKLNKSGENQNNSSFNVDSLQNSQQNISQFQIQLNSSTYEKNTNILSQNQISTKRQLQKQLFYINTSTIGETTLAKWFEKNRTNIQLTNHIIQALKNQINIFFLSALLQLSTYQQRSQIKFLACQKFTHSLGFRVFVNGIKRMLQIQIRPSLNDVNIVQKLKQIQNTLKLIPGKNISFWIYMLSGWIPQSIQCFDDQKTKNVLATISKSYHRQNIMLSIANKQLTQILIASQINQQSQTIKANKITITQQGKQIAFDFEIRWEQIYSNFTKFYLNWNPMVYNFNKRVQGIIKDSLNTPNQLNALKQGSIKYLIKIPPSKSQVQVRLFAQIHHSNSTQNIKNFQLIIYEFNAHQLDIQKNNDPIRCIRSNGKYFLSEIFVFERSHSYSQYLFSIRVNRQNYKDLLNIQVPTNSSKFNEQPQNNQITMEFYTFCQISVKQYQQPVLIQKTDLTLISTAQNAGFGMNSPYFDSNIQFNLNTFRKTINRVNIKYQSSKPINFQLCVIPNPNKLKNIAFFKSSQLVKNIMQSAQYQNQGFFQFLAQQQNYLIVIVNFTAQQAKITIAVETYSTFEAIYRNQNSNKLSIQILSNQKIFYKESIFNWTDLDPGPRKRTSSNSQDRFYPIGQFSNHFQNPYIDCNIQKGIYQFSIVSKTFIQSINKQQMNLNDIGCILNILNAYPPSLSLSIFILNQRKDEAKILLDDVQYIPYGIGFWTDIMKMQGLYRFVFSKYEKSNQIGTFRIRKLFIQ